MANLKDQKRYHFIYKTTFLPDGKYYIGMHSTSNLNDGYLGSGTRLRRMIRKYGKDHFSCEILEYFDTRELLAEREAELVTKDLLWDPKCLNLKKGGEGGFPSWVGWQNKAHQLKYNGKQAFLDKIKNDPKFRESFSRKVSERNKKAFENGTRSRDPWFDWTGRKHRSDTIEKMKEVKKGWGAGNKNSQFGTMWITNGKDRKKIRVGDIIPEGWHSRKLLPPPPTMWITNGINSTLIKSTDNIPEGWNKGRTFKSKG